MSTIIRARSKSHLRLRLWAIGVVVSTFSASARGEDETWTGIGGNNLWSTPSNWADGTPPVSSSTLTVYLPGSPVPISFQNIANPLRLNRLEFPAGPHDVAGAPLRFEGTAPSISTFANPDFFPTIQNNIVINSAELLLFASLNGGALTLSGVISETGGARRLRPVSGRVILTGANTYSGGTLVDTTLTVSSNANLGAAAGPVDFVAGTLEFSAVFACNRPTTISNSGGFDTNEFNVTWSGPISGAGSLSKRGAGTLALTGANDYSGPTFCSEGVLEISSDQNIGEGIIELGAGVLRIAGAAFPTITSTTRVFDNEGRIDVSAAANSATLNSRIVCGHQECLLGICFDYPANRFVKGGPGQLVLPGFSFLPLPIVRILEGTLKLTDVGIAPGQIEVTSSTLALDYTEAGDAPAPISISAGTLQIDGTNVHQTNGAITWDAGGAEIGVTQASHVFTLLEATGGTGPFRKFGAGTLEVRQALDASTIEVAGGSLRALPPDADLADFAPLLIDLSATLEVGDVEVVGSLSGGGSVVLNNGTVLETGLDGGNGDFFGSISGAGTLAKVGSGELLLRGPNTYSGGTRVDEGTLRVVAGALPAASGVQLGQSTTLIFDYPGNGVFAGAIDAYGSVIKVGNGMLTLSGTLTYSGATTVSAGTLICSDGVTPVGSSLSIADGARLVTSGWLAPPITGTGTLQAGGPLIVGDLSSTSGYAFGGTLQINNQQVILLDADGANLGPLTTLGPGGYLATLNGALLSAGETLNALGPMMCCASTIDGPFTNNGTVNGASAAGPNFLTFIDDVDGCGSYSGNILFSDGFSPGCSPANINFNGNLTLDASADLLIELGGLTAGTQHDRLTVTGAAAIGGTLRIRLINGFTPAPGDAFTVVAAGTRSGTFGQIVTEPADLDIDVLYTSSAVVLQAAAAFAPGDMNCDGAVTVSDIAGFVLALTNPTQYAIEFPACNINNADVNGDTAVTVSDIGPFVALLTGG